MPQQQHTCYPPLRTYDCTYVPCSLYTHREYRDTAHNKEHGTLVGIHEEVFVTAGIIKDGLDGCKIHFCLVYISSGRCWALCVAMLWHKPCFLWKQEMHSKLPAGVFSIEEGFLWAIFSVRSSRVTGTPSQQMLSMHFRSSCPTFTRNPSGLACVAFLLPPNPLTKSHRLLMRNL